MVQKTWDGLHKHDQLMDIKSNVYHKELLSPYSRSKASIPQDIYTGIRQFIISVLSTEGEATIGRLLEGTLEDIRTTLGKNTNWYVLQVKLDMEARKEIKVSKKGPAGMPLLKLTSLSRI